MTPSLCRLPSASTNPRGSVNANSVCSMAFQISHGLMEAYARFNSSCVISKVSIATVALVELNEGPVHLVGQALEKFHRIFSAPVSSNSTIEPFLRSVLPSMAVCRHFHNSSVSVMPRLSVIGEYLFSPDSLRTWLGSVPSR